MADLQPTLGSNQKKIRKRGSNYTVSETVIIEEEYLKNRWLLEGKFSDKVTNAKKQQVWEMITQKVNAAGSKVRTVEKIKEKWRAEMKKAKKEYRTFIEDRSKTGGGRPPADLSSTTSRIIDMYKETAGFCGIPGSENLETFVMNDDSSCKDSTTDTCLATDERDIIEDIVVTLTGDNLENSSVYKPTSDEDTEVVAGTSDRLQDIGTSNPISQNKETTAAKLKPKRVQVKDLQALQRDYFIGEMEVQAEKKKYLAAKTEMVMEQTLFYKKMAAFFDDKKVIQWPSADE